MEFTTWQFALVICKLILYVGIAGAIATPCMHWLLRAVNNQQDCFKRYGMLSIITALIAVILGFFLQVGSFVEEGFSGMLDTEIMNIIWQSNAGTASRWLALALVSLLLCQMLLAGHRKSAVLFFSSGLLLLGAAFTNIGHLADSSIWLQLLLLLHVGIAFSWLGSLWPLLRTCGYLTASELARLMELFGRCAAVIVPLLLLAGFVIAYQLVGSFDLLFGSDYGQLLLLKLMMVAAILSLAALHKWRLVPALNSDNNVQARAILAKSIIVEICLALLILSITTVLSTLVGPVH
ncbi:MAG: CopD family protein [Psychrobium sp.]|nr:CopD family protein [Psychrobium sp.]